MVKPQRHTQPGKNRFKPLALSIHLIAAASMGRC